MVETSSQKIRIDKDGIWYFEGKEIFRNEIVRFFYENLKQDQRGRFLIELDNEQCYVDIEDTPFIIESIDKNKLEGDNQEIIFMNLKNGAIEKLNPETLWIGKKNILYCMIKKGSCKARFSRAAYYQIANLIEHDIKTDMYFIFLNGNTFYIKEAFN